MAVYYDNTSLKAKHERKRSLEELTKENKELKTRLQATEDKEYHALGGNGTVTSLVNSIRELDVRDDKRPASQE